ncbi:MAG: 5'(3')-deoxyribonucleotidase [Chitinophagaceae bacterium]|nr:5'(3')-deoxyribonucleotidase [Chitinophagaceae bacterium]MCW5925375.1 5'(3')-deoxyribonucleotidase [Chitinophagaceae bacterium]
MQRVIVDMDEVMADTMGGMLEWYTKEYGLPVDYSKMVGAWAPGFPEQHRATVIERLYSEGFFRHLPVMENCVEVLEEVNKKYELFIVSAATEFPNSLRDKLEWLNEHFPYLTWRQLVLCGDKRLVAGDYMFDDHTRNLVHFPGKPYLYSTIMNAHENGYDRVANWKEIADILL